MPKEEKLPCIVIDTREKNEDIARVLNNMGIVVFKETLPTGDFLIGDILIERKTINDLWGSLTDQYKRLDFQRKRLRDLADEFHPYILIEGRWNAQVGKLRTIYKKKHGTKRGFNWQVYKQRLIGVYNAIATDPVIGHFRTETDTETCELLKNLALKQPHDAKKLRALRGSPGKELTLDEWQQHILEGFPKVGPITADKLLKWGNGLYNVLEFLVRSGDYFHDNSYPKELKKSSKLYQRIEAIVYHQYKREEEHVRDHDTDEATD